MFKELAPLLSRGGSIALTLSRENDTQLRVNVMPKLFTLDAAQGPDGKPDSGRKALSTPLTITGTPEELDSPEFIATLNRFTASAGALRQSIDDVEAAHKAAAATRKAGSRTSAVAAKPATPARTSATPQEEKEEQEKEKPAPKPAEKPSAEDLTPSIL